MVSGGKVSSLHFISTQEEKGRAMQSNDVNQGRAEAVQAAIAELTTKWGYRDISALIAVINTLNTEEDPQYADPTTYLCVLQTPEGGPIYCKTAKRLFRELEAARVRNKPYTQCPAPNPEQNLWMVVGNFAPDDEDEEEG
jgi:hypothetical protein